MDSKSKIVIVGGGIAGITCLDTLLDDYDPIKPTYRSITLISESKIIKTVLNYNNRGRNLESFDIQPDDASSYYRSKIPKNLEFCFVVGKVTCIDSKEKLIHVDLLTNQSKIYKRRTIDYDVLCLCHGSHPETLDILDKSQKGVLDRIVTIRDTNSINQLKQRLVDSKKIVIIGNGGISLELVDKLVDCDIEWLIRDEYVGHPFLDSEASKFLLEVFYKKLEGAESSSKDRKVLYTADNTDATLGPALGPHWSQNIILAGGHDKGKKLTISCQTEVINIVFDEKNQHPIRVLMRDSKSICCDLVILAIGVKPSAIEFKFTSPNRSSNNGGILIDDQMRTNIQDIYAAGDVVSCEFWPHDGLWFQMRLWTQARQMGHYCGKCISAHLIGENPTIFANFECFTHITEFFGFKLVLLGRYTDQHLTKLDAKEIEVIVRINRYKDYIKLVLKDDKVIGAILVGDTNLEETIENLIYDQVDVSNIKDQLLDDTIDIEDYFD